MVSDRHPQQVGAHELLGTSQAEVAHELLTATSKRALHLALALALVSWKQSTTKDTWRQTYPHDIAEATLTAPGRWATNSPTSNPADRRNQPPTRLTRAA